MKLLLLSEARALQLAGISLALQTIITTLRRPTGNLVSDAFLCPQLWTAVRCHVTAATWL
jgi:hypothetical protein